jgi:hypothetical protein
LYSLPLLQLGVYSEVVYQALISLEEFKVVVPHQEVYLDKHQELTHLQQDQTNLHLEEISLEVKHHKHKSHQDLVDLHYSDHKP